jgi:hypothetical protein
MVCPLPTIFEGKAWRSQINKRLTNNLPGRTQVDTQWSFSNNDCKSRKEAFSLRNQASTNNEISVTLSGVTSRVNLTVSTVMPKI